MEDKYVYAIYVTPLALAMALFSSEMHAGETILSDRVETLGAIQALLGKTEIEGPSSLEAGVFVAQAILGERKDDFSGSHAERLMYCIGYSLAGREDDLRVLFRNPGDDTEKSLVELAVNFLLLGGHQQIASRVIDSPEYSGLRTGVLESSYLEALMRDDQDAMTFLKSQIPKDRIEQVEELNVTKIRRASFSRQFAKTCGSQWLLASPDNISFVTDSNTQKDKPIEAAGVALYHAIKDREEVSADALSALEGQEDYRGLLTLYRLRQIGCDGFQEGLSLDVVSKFEFRARFAALITCDAARAATILSQVNERYISDAVFQLSAYAQSTLSDEETVSLSRRIESETLRLFFLCCSLVK